MTEVWGIFRKEDEQMGTFSPADILIPILFRARLALIWEC